MIGEYALSVNGFPLLARYSSREISQALDPVLDALYAVRARRVIAFLAGPPGAGKSTLALSLCERAKERGLSPAVQALGLDGFHYPNDILRARSAVIDGRETRLIDVKGRPETFDCARFCACLARAARAPEARWPAYDRRIHDVADEEERVTAGILLVEGNWLLLERGEWKSARETADITVSLSAPMDELARRLVARKMRGGMDEAAARAWFTRVDGPNCALFARESARADLRLWLTPDGLCLDDASKVVGGV